MSHELDFSTGSAAIAYVGAAPWHKLGAELSAGSDIATWTREARLDYSVLSAPVMYNTPGLQSEPQISKSRKVLYRSDNGGELGIVSDQYHPVQPAEVMGFFAKLVDIGGFQLETAGALSHGRRIWALARVGEGREIRGLSQDLIKPYVLLATSYDGTMATIAKFTSVRVVCHNTITMALGRENQQAVRVFHRERFDADKVRQQLGIAADSFESFMIDAQQLAGRSMNRLEADDFMADLMRPYSQNNKDVRETRAYKRLMELFDGAAIGSDLPGVFGTRWQALNAVTQLVDHEKGRTDSTRIDSAWFGTGAALKTRALETLKALA